MSKTLLELKNLWKKYPVYGPLGKLAGPRTHMSAVADLSLAIGEGETYGLVGESGCGKTTTGRVILGLTKSDGGEVLYRGQDLTKLSPQRLRPLRREIQLVFQDPLSSLNPRQRIGGLLEEPLSIQRMGDRESRRSRVMETLERVGLSAEHYFRYPHELSGGQVQRLGLARALIIRPKLIVCDEPVSALDVSIQAQILNMMQEIQRDMGLSLLFISHDIGVVRYISDRVGVMYLGSLMEEASTQELFSNPLHPYTQALFAAVPDFSERQGARAVLQGERPVRTDGFRGCVFHTRCPKATEHCREEAPALRELTPGHRVACHCV